MANIREAKAAKDKLQQWCDSTSVKATIRVAFLERNPPVLGLEILLTESENKGISWGTQYDNVPLRVIKIPTNASAMNKN